MEYKIFNFLREKLKFPYFLRVFFAVFLIIIWIIFIIFVLFWSVVVWVFILIIWFILIVKVDKVRYLVKLRRSMIYMFANFFKKEKRVQKIKDIKRDLKKIFEKEEKK